MASYYRPNKFNENIRVEKYCCGSCKYYEFEREDRKNYCSCYRDYYPIDDSCKNNWERASDVSGGGFFDW